MRRALFIIGCTLVLLTPLSGQEHPNEAKGFSPNNVFHFNDLDHVNVFNGNLVVTLPIGIQYPVSSNLHYGLSLTYNSQVWDYVERKYTNSLGDHYYVKALPSHSSNAGIGWLLSMGRMITPTDEDNLTGDPTTVPPTPGGFVYQGPDRSQHEFWPRLHPNDAVYDGSSDYTSTYTTTQVLYTTDGTYLRFKEKAPTTGGDHWYEVEFPDGTIQQYDVTGRLVQIRDRFGNHVDISYNPSGDAPRYAGGDVWRITDQHSSGNSRIHHVYFRPYYYDGQRGGNKQMVAAVVFAAFGGATSEYDFTYTETVDGTGTATLPRGCPNTDPTNFTLARVPLLSGIALPDGSSYAFVYKQSNSLPSAGKCESGMIESLTLPTKGSINWDYGTYSYPAGPGTEPQRTRETGVRSRTLVDAGSSPTESDGVNRTWSYGTALGPNLTCPGPPGGNPGTCPGYLTATATDPLGNRTLNYFNVYTYGDTTGTWVPGEYGRPYSRHDLSHSPLFPSTQVIPAGAGTPIRSTWVRYEDDGSNTQTNMRLASSRTDYVDDNTYTQEDAIDFDGLGHYRNRSTTSNFSGQATHSVRTAFNLRDNDVDPNGLPNVGTLGSTFTMLAASDPWVLNTSTSITTTEGNASTKSLFCFDPATGFLKRQRTMIGLVPGGADVITRLTHANGNVTLEEYFGGDTQPMNTDALCTSSITSVSPKYRVEHTYQYGSPRQSRYLDPNGTPLTFWTADADIDQNTGLVALSRDTALVPTTYSYDTSGRLRSAATPGLAPLTYTPTLADGTTPATVLVRQQSTTGNIDQTFTYDAFGRLALEQKTIPGGTGVSQRQTKYNAAGGKASQSSWEQTPTHFTVFSGFDAFGRPGTITPPDSTAQHNTTTTLIYKGVRVIERTSRLGATLTPSTTREIRDLLGRVYQVQEPGTDGTLTSPNSTTTYTYDVGSRLASVQMQAGSTTQPRSFTYDHRGFLSQETHPENGTTTYSGYDARGHAHWRTVNTTNDIFDLQFTYDTAERLIQIDARNPYYPSEFRVGKIFSYANANVSANLQLGKLASAVRHNYHPIPGDITVTETYEYGDAAGRLTKKTTEIRNASSFGQDPLNQKLEQSYTYNDLSEPTLVTYPSCQLILCGENPAWNAISPTYTTGALHDITGFTTGITYASTGATQTVLHSNGVLDTITPDSNGLPRPANITFTGTAPCTIPTIGAPDQSIPYGTSTTLVVTATGTPPYVYQWYDDGNVPTNSSKINGATNSTYTTPSITGTRGFWIVVANSCGHAQHRVIVTPTFVTPTNLVATANGTTQVTITWSAVNADHYEIERRANGSGFSRVATPTTASYTDFNVTANTTYVYRVRAADAYASATSNYSNSDLATTMTFTAAAIGGPILASYWSELLAGVNAVRACHGDTPLTWAAVLHDTPAPAPAPNVLIYAVHITRLRTEMNAALQALSLPLTTYTDPFLDVGTIIRAIHVTDLQNRTR